MSGVFPPSSIAAMPVALPLFPLEGAVVLPRGVLPLSVFESRYREMVTDVLGGARMIGIIQPSAPTLSPIPNDAPLYDVGCAGFVSDYRHNDDGTYLIGLIGVCRFRLVEELAPLGPYRLARPDYEEFANDLDEQSDEPPPRALLNALEVYLTRRVIAADREALYSMRQSELINQLVLGLPLSCPEKQALLEVPDLPARCQMLTGLLKMCAFESSSGTEGGYN